MTDNTEIELELTYLAREMPPEIKGIQPVVMEDVYFPDNVSHAQLRARHKGDKYEITKKQPLKEGDASVQTEQTISLTKPEFEALTLSSTKKVKKLRYNTLINNYPAEVDVFQDALEGLVLIDFEFETAEDKELFKQPEVAHFRQ